MLLLVNTNRMQPPIAPVGLDYVATSARRRNVPVEVVDLGLVEDAHEALERSLARRQPRLVGLSYRNVDDSFWPSAQSFLPELVHLMRAVRGLTDAPVVLGGVGFSVFAARIVEHTGAEYGIRGDGEESLVQLYGHLSRGGKPGSAELSTIPGLVWREGGRLVANQPAWRPVDVPAARDAIDNATYFALGGQLGVETKRGCPRSCIYCADPLAKGVRIRPRSPTAVAAEFESLWAQGVTCIHLCDGEFNVPRGHALRICEELVRKNLPARVGWYAYAAVTPFDDDLAAACKRAGCRGLDFTGDAANDEMLKRYHVEHRQADVALAVSLCRRHGIPCMVDLLLGGPGETRDTVRQTLQRLELIGPDCVGVGLGMRLYPGTPVVRALEAGGPLDQNPGVVRKYPGPLDLLQPTYYLSPALGERPAAFIRRVVAGDPRFFVPADEVSGGHEGSDHNYNANFDLVRAIRAGARGAYWDILRRAASSDKGASSASSGTSSAAPD